MARAVAEQRVNSTLWSDAFSGSTHTRTKIILAD
jgi:hypothetical protein